MLWTAVFFLQWIVVLCCCNVNRSGKEVFEYLLWNPSFCSRLEVVLHKSVLLFGFQRLNRLHDDFKGESFVRTKKMPLRRNSRKWCFHSENEEFSVFFLLFFLNGLPCFSPVFAVVYVFLSYCLIFLLLLLFHAVLCWYWCHPLVELWFPRGHWRTAKSSRCSNNVS